MSVYESCATKISRQSLRFTHGGLWWVIVPVTLLIAMTTYPTKAIEEGLIMAYSSRVGSMMVHNDEVGQVRGERINDTVLCCQCMCMCVCVCVCVNTYQIFRSRKYNDHFLRTEKS